MRLRTSEKGSTHIIIVVVVIILVIGVIGFVFLQNFINKKDTSTEQTTTKTDETPVVDKVAQAKLGITAAMKALQYRGLTAYMTEKLDGAIAYSDGIFAGKTSQEMTDLIYDYFHSSNPEVFSTVGTWTFADFKDVTDEKLVATAKDSTFFDFKDSYVGLAHGTDVDIFVAYKLNGDGLITYAFFGLLP